MQERKDMPQIADGMRVHSDGTACLDDLCFDEGCEYQNMSDLIPAQRFGDDVFDCE